MWWVWLLATLGGLVAILLVLLAIPVDLVFQLEVHNAKVVSHARVGWLFNRVSWEMRRPRPGRAARKKRARRPGGRMARAAWRALRTKGLLRETRRLVMGLFRCVKLRDLGLDLRVGLGDPFSTGILFAFVGPVAGIIRSQVPYEVSVAPVFDGAAQIDGRSWADVRFSPLRVAVVLKRFALSGPGLRAARILVGGMRKS